MTIHSAVYHHLSENMNISEKQHNIAETNRTQMCFLVGAKPCSQEKRF